MPLNTNYVTAYFSLNWLFSLSNQLFWATRYRKNASYMVRTCKMHLILIPGAFDTESRLLRERRESGSHASSSGSFDSGPSLETHCRDFASTSINPPLTGSREYKLVSRDPRGTIYCLIESLACCIASSYPGRHSFQRLPGRRDYINAAQKALQSHIPWVISKSRFTGRKSYCIQGATSISMYPRSHSLYDSNCWIPSHIYSQACSDRCLELYGCTKDDARPESCALPSLLLSSFALRVYYHWLVNSVQRRSTSRSQIRIWLSTSPAA